MFSTTAKPPETRPQSAIKKNQKKKGTSRHYEPIVVYRYRPRSRLLTAVPTPLRHNSSSTSCFSLYLCFISLKPPQLIPSIFPHFFSIFTHFHPKSFLFTKSFSFPTNFISYFFFFFFFKFISLHLSTIPILFSLLFFFLLRNLISSFSSSNFSYLVFNFDFCFGFYNNGTNQETKEHQGGWFFKPSSTLTSKDILKHVLEVTFLTLLI